MRRKRRISASSRCQRRQQSGAHTGAPIGCGYGSSWRDGLFQVAVSRTRTLKSGSDCGPAACRPRRRQRQSRQKGAAATRVSTQGQPDDTSRDLATYWTPVASTRLAGRAEVRRGGKRTRRRVYTTSTSSRSLGRRLALKRRHTRCISVRRQLPRTMCPDFILDMIARSADAGSSDFKLRSPCMAAAVTRWESE